MRIKGSVLIGESTLTSFGQKVLGTWVCLVGLLTPACGPVPAVGTEGDRDLGVATEALTTVLTDDQGPMHIQVKLCETEYAEETPSITCKVDNGYALVGGGAWAQWASAGALLMFSYPLPDRRTWYAGSTSNTYGDSHKLIAYAIGLRIDGFNSKRLRERLLLGSGTGPSGPNGVSIPSMTVSVGSAQFGGGARAYPWGQFLTTTKRSGTGQWFASSRDNIGSQPGWIESFGLSMDTVGILEKLGPLEIQYKTGNTDTHATGIGLSNGTLSTGYVLAGLGADATTTSGGGRMLYGLGTNGDARHVIAASKDHGIVSAGNTTVNWVQVRRSPNSHGVCNTGGALSASTDPCIASICAQQSSCCSSSWSSSCVAKVTTVCGKTCTPYTCSTPSYDPTNWNTEPNYTRQNCYNYARNIMAAGAMIPGEASGENCGTTGETWDTCMTLARQSQFAINDGLIPTTKAAGCPAPLTMVVQYVRPEGDHWLRKDANGKWSQKIGTGNPATNLDVEGHIITDPDAANLGVMDNLPGAYYCVCSDAQQGKGHTEL